MDVSIDYVTTFTYASPVRESQNIVRACPVDEPGQQLVSYRIETDPSSRILHHRDAWGTRIDTFGILEPHRSLTVRAHADVRTFDRPVPPDDPPAPGQGAGDPADVAVGDREEVADQVADGVVEGVDVAAAVGGDVSGPPGAANLPVFWHVDPVAKVARSKGAESGERIATDPVAAGIYLKARSAQTDD